MFIKFENILRVSLLISATGLAACGSRDEATGKKTTGTTTTTPVCGDAICDASESCLACESDCGACAPFCGDGERDLAEECDGDDLEITRCSQLGLGNGFLNCTGDCRLDTSECDGGAVCGDGVVDDGEDCDGMNLLGETCRTLGFDGGSLRCTNCQLDDSGCENEPEPPADSDGDGIADELDNCATRPNTNQADVDADGIGNVCDNCAQLTNPDQLDSDFDGIGDACSVVPVEEVILELEPNDDLSDELQRLTIGRLVPTIIVAVTSNPVTGTGSYDMNDFDVFELFVTDPGTVFVQVASSTADVDLYIDEGDVAFSADDSFDEGVSFSVPAARVYRIEIAVWGGRAGPYTLAVDWSDAARCLKADKLQIIERGTVGWYPTMVTDELGNIHVTYYDAAGGDLRYATSAVGFWGASAVDTVGNVGAPSALALDSNGTPHVAYYDSTNKDIKYATMISGVWVKEIVTATNDVGLSNSIIVDDDDSVHIFYYDDTTDDLIHATDKPGEWVTENVDTQGDVGRDVTAVVDSEGFIHMAYYDATNRDLKYAQNKLGFWHLQTIDAAGDVGTHPSIAIDEDGTIHIAYLKESTDTIKYASTRDGFFVPEEIEEIGEQDVGIQVLSNGEEVYVLYTLDLTDGTARTPTGELRLAERGKRAWLIRSVFGESVATPAAMMDAAGDVHLAVRHAAVDGLSYLNGSCE
jgi:hypothetical protein